MNAALTDLEHLAVLAALTRVLIDNEPLADAVPSALRDLPDNDSRRRVKDAIFGVGVMRLRLAHLATLLGMPPSPSTLLSIFFNDDGAGDDTIHWSDDPAQAVALRRSCPPWLTERLVNSLGVNDADAFLAASNRPGPVTLRANTLKTTPTDLIAALADDGIVARENPATPWTVDVVGHSNIFGSTAWRSGLFEVQDASSQLVAMACDALPGDIVVDLCAGRGGKTLALAAAMRNTGRLLVNDIDDSALRALRGRLRRAGVVCVDSVNGTDAVADLGGADVVLVDAPCSSVGVLRRFPDRRFTVTAAEVDDLVPVQQALLARAATLVRPGGRVVYATCSVLRDENEAVAHTAPPSLSVLSQQTLLPHIDGGDGFFISTFLRTDG